MPYFSFLMPVKNREKLITRAINSCITQTEQDWELVIADDRSDDSTRKIATRFAKKDPRIKLVALSGKDLSGAAGARTEAISASSGEIIVVADSDDESYPNRLAQLKEAFQRNKKIEAAYGQLTVVDGNKNYTRIGHPFKLELLKIYNYIPNPAAAYKRSVFDKVGGYDLSLSTNEDYDLWLKIAETGGLIVQVPHPHTILYKHDERLTSTIDFEKHRINLAKVRKKHDLQTPSLADAKKNIDDASELQYLTSEKAELFWFTNPKIN